MTHRSKTKNYDSPERLGHVTNTSVNRYVRGLHEVCPAIQCRTPEPECERPATQQSKPLKHIVNEFLNSHVFERKCFNDLYVIMAFNNPFDYKLRKSAVIGFVQHPEKFTKFDPFGVSAQRQYQTGLVYAVYEFDKQTFDMLNLKSLDREVFFDISKSVNASFEETKAVLNEFNFKFNDIDFDDAFVVMFNLNNYFDILQDGVYNSETSKEKHEGFVVLVEPDYKLERLILRITWSYYDGTLDIEFDVEDEGFFNMEVSHLLPPAVCREYWSLHSGLKIADVSKLEIDLQQSKSRVETLQSGIDLEERKQKRIEKKLDELKH